MPRHRRMLVALLLVIFALRVADTYTVFNEITDENLHVATGLEYLEKRQYTLEAQHPPLARAVVAALPYFVMGFRLPEGYSFGNRLWGDTGVADYWLALSLARLGNLVFAMMLAWFVYRWGSALHGPNLGLVACFLVTFSPNVIAHAGLATLDIGATATAIAATYHYYRWAVKPSLGICVLSAVWTGIAALTKMSAVVFLPAAFVLIFAVIKGVGAFPSWFTWKVLVRAAKRAAVFVVVVGGVIWAGYFFHVGYLPELKPLKCSVAMPVSDIITEILSRYPLPAPEFFQGIVEVLRHNNCGHGAYLLGDVSARGWWYYFPIAIGVKSSIPLLLLFAMAIGVAVGGGLAGRARAVWVPAAALSAVLGAGMASDINIGIRHVLAVYPLMALVAVAAAPRQAALRQIGPRLVVAVLLVIWHGVESLAAHPDYLPYFNQVARGREQKFLTDSNLDWGQDLERLSGFLKDNPDPAFRLIYGGPARPALLGVSVLRAASGKGSHPGWLAVSAHRLVHWRGNIPALNQLWDRAPDIRVGKSMLLYRLSDTPYKLLEPYEGSRIETIAAPDGLSLPVVRGSMDGWVDGMSWSRNVLRLEGWATSGNFRKVASRILVFIDGEGEESWYQRKARPDVQRTYPGMHRAGYSIELALQLTRSGAQPEIRVFAISAAGMASELHYHKSYGRGDREYVLGKTGSK